MDHEYDESCDHCGSGEGERFGITPLQFVRAVKILYSKGCLDELNVYDSTINYVYHADNEKQFSKTIDTNVVENLDFILTQLELHKVPYQCHIVGS